MDLFLAVLGLCCCAQVFLCLLPGGAYSSLQHPGLLIVVASLAVEQGALGRRASVVLQWASVVVAGFRSRGGLP